MRTLAIFSATAFMFAATSVPIAGPFSAGVGATPAFAQAKSKARAASAPFCPRAPDDRLWQTWFDAYCNPSTMTAWQSAWR